MRMWSCGTLAALGGVAAAGVALWRIPWWIDHRYLNNGLSQPVATTVTGVRTALLALGAGALAAVGILYTHRTLHQTREGQVTDRYARAITQIASDKPVEQLGGIYALERIMRDSPKDHATIVEVLAAFVREHAPAPAKTDTHDRLRLARRRSQDRMPHGATPRRPDATLLRPTEPVQAALTVLGRRPQDRHEPFRLNLARTNLRGADLHEANLRRAILEDSHLQHTNLRLASLQDAVLRRAQLERANLRGGHLEGADLSNADLTRAKLIKTHFDQGSSLYRTSLDEANLSGANLEQVEELTAKQITSARPTPETRLPTYIATDNGVIARIAAVEVIRAWEVSRAWEASLSEDAERNQTS
ncbi:pentapeptide repeat-containing protein [Streptomyces sp. NPDC021100]|uniref:pentapeptide repeat-containing protein n=1 Tax=Streptomyces sp. NPDC021100 TaxID=3365114 RepID=UPI003787F77C